MPRAKEVSVYLPQSRRHVMQRGRTMTDVRTLEILGPIECLLFLQ